LDMPVKRAVFASLAVLLAAAELLVAADAARSEWDVKRDAAIAEFTRKMKEANYPPLFEKAAQEFNVPADILKGVAFAETRWEQLTWPPGETASPETGMPRPYGIMSLWDNEYFGHSLLEAAALIGKSPEELKQDAYQNMRGAAALLRKIYDENPKPDGTAPTDVESWRSAIRKYSGIPEPDLNAQHALEVYVWMSQGYHQYGIEWNARPVDLSLMREETKRIVAEEQAKREARMAANSNQMTAAVQQPLTNAKPTPAAQPDKQAKKPAAQAVAPAPVEAAAPSNLRIWWLLAAALALLVLIIVVIRKQSKASKP
jgi:hypothetical protein